MSMDQQLTRALREEVERHDVPEPDLGSIVAGGRRRQRATVVRRIAVGLVAGVAVLAATLAGSDLLTSRSLEPVGPHRGTPETVQDLPVGALPAIPYCSGNDTILGAGAPIKLACGPLVHHGNGTVRAGVDGIYVLQDGRATLLDRRLPWAWFPALSRDGRYAAWVAVGPSAPDDAVLLVYDLTNRTRVAEVDFPTPEVGTAGIDDLGRVYFESFHDRRVWAYDIHAQRSFEVTGLPLHASPSIAFVTSDGFGTVQLGIDSLFSTVGVVTTDGRFISQHSVPISTGAFSPDGTHFAMADNQGFVITTPDGGSRVRLKLPKDGEGISAPVWETDSTVLVVFDPEYSIPLRFDPDSGTKTPARRTFLVRCSTDTGDCETALTPQDLGELMGSTYP